MAMAVEVTRRRFTADEYHEMARVGILHEDDRVELIDGEILAMSPIGTRHVGVVNRLTSFFITTLGRSAVVQPQGSVRLSFNTEPQPDLALLRYRSDFYDTKHAGPDDILLIIEVADSSLRYDRTVKAELYARLGIVEYWIADLGSNAIIRHLDPVDGHYRRVESIPAGAPFSPHQLPQCVMTSADVFGTPSATS